MSEEEHLMEYPVTISETMLSLALCHEVAIGFSSLVKPSITGLSVKLDYRTLTEQSYNV